MVGFIFHYVGKLQSGSGFKHLSTCPLLVFTQGKRMVFIASEDPLFLRTQLCGSLHKIVYLFKKPETKLG